MGTLQGKLHPFLGKENRSKKKSLATWQRNSGTSYLTQPPINEHFIGEAENHVFHFFLIKYCIPNPAMRTRHFSTHKKQTASPNLMDVHHPKREKKYTSFHPQLSILRFVVIGFQFRESNKNILQSFPTSLFFAGGFFWGISYSWGWAFIGGIGGVFFSSLHHLV